MVRFFSVASLITIVAAATLLTTLYRQVAIHDIVSFGERSNLVVAQGFLNALHAPLVEYLLHEEAHHGGALPVDLAQAIRRLMEDTAVVRIKIYDDEAIVVYSTREDQIGRYVIDNAGYRSAMSGSVMSKLIYRDGFNPFDRETESDNLIQSYVPIREHPGAPALGVFEVYTDANPMVAEIERGQLSVLGGGLGVLTLLYLSLLAIVRHAERIIKGQQQSIRERSRALEVLSSQLLTAQEQEKKRVAQELHEGIVQTLSGIKYQIEHAHRRAGAPTEAPSLHAVVPLLQTTIREVRSLAMELRPSSLDDMGVIATLEWYCREFRTVYPEVSLELAIGIRESDITPPLKVILYRLIQQTLQCFARHECTTRIALTLTRATDGVHLQVSNDCAVENYEQGDLESFRIAVRERIALSGGSAAFSDNAQGGITLSALWGA